MKLVHVYKHLNNIHIEVPNIHVQAIKYIFRTAGELLVKNIFLAFHNYPKHAMHFPQEFKMV